jgi:hypothetical protein
MSTARNNRKETSIQELQIECDKLIDQYLKKVLDNANEADLRQLRKRLKAIRDEEWALFES